MGRPVTKEVVLRSGFYIEVRRGNSGKGVMIRSDSKTAMESAYNRYSKSSMYEVKLVGEVKKGKVVKSA